MTEYGDVCVCVCVWRFLIPEARTVSSPLTDTHTVTHKALSGDTALMAARAYCENSELCALLVPNKAAGSEL